MKRLRDCKVQTKRATAWQRSSFASRSPTLHELSHNKHNHHRLAPAPLIANASAVASGRGQTSTGDEAF